MLRRERQDRSGNFLSSELVLVEASWQLDWQRTIAQAHKLHEDVMLLELSEISVVYSVFSRSPVNIRTRYAPLLLNSLLILQLGIYIDS